MAMKLVPISLEEYRILHDAGAWVYADHRRNHTVDINAPSDAHNPLWRDLDWRYCYTRVEE